MLAVSDATTSAATPSVSGNVQHHVAQDLLDCANCAATEIFPALHLAALKMVASCPGECRLKGTVAAIQIKSANSVYPDSSASHLNAFSIRRVLYMLHLDQNCSCLPQHGVWLCLQVEQQKVHVGDLRQQLAVATAEGAEHNERAIQTAALVDGLRGQVSFSECSTLKHCEQHIQNTAC